MNCPYCGMPMDFGVCGEDNNCHHELQSDFCDEIARLNRRVQVLEAFVREYADHATNCKSRDEFGRGCNCDYRGELEKALGVAKDVK